jgi:hypothetical protein
MDDIRCRRVRSNGDNGKQADDSSKAGEIHKNIS